jgi:hypothetical protein
VGHALAHALSRLTQAEGPAWFLAASSERPCEELKATKRTGWNQQHPFKDRAAHLAFQPLKIVLGNKSG